MIAINTAKIQELHREAGETAGKGKIIPFPQREPDTRAVEYWTTLADVAGDYIGLDEPTPALQPADPALRERFLKDVEAARQRRLEARWGKMEVPTNFRGLTPQSLVAAYGQTNGKRGKTDAIKAAYAWAGVTPATDEKDEVVGNPTSKFPGLLIYGEPGTGKSALAWWAVQKRGWGLWLTWNDLLGKIQNEWEGRESLIEAAQSAPVLFLDDLGDPSTGNGRVSDDRRNILFRIINHRLANRLPTIITSNINGGNLNVVLVNLERQFDQRIVDRLFELCHFVEMGGANLRKSPRKEQ